MQFKQDINDRRTGVRIQTPAQVKVQPKGATEVFVSTASDVSVSGLAMVNGLPKEFLGQPCFLQIVFRGEHSRLVIDQLAGEIVRTTHPAAISFAKPLEWLLLFTVYQKKLSQARG
ncbi:PilZ domain-containing protein [Desulfogranum mediterraneum]|uniref:PilZ domain-containing protein n=1 Tax=Desulfogranum mediterraneum TaxID=160661 RepID=UPI00040AD729|nr:PilZ domain-containing protein [Desulfogranum mediterraneum]